MGFLKRHPTLFLSIGITLLFLWLDLFSISFFENLELKRYDLMMGLRSQPEASSDIVMVDIDDDFNGQEMKEQQMIYAAVNGLKMEGCWACPVRCKKRRPRCRSATWLAFRSRY